MGNSSWEIPDGKFKLGNSAWKSQNWKLKVEISMWEIRFVPDGCMIFALM